MPNIGCEDVWENYLEGPYYQFWKDNKRWTIIWKVVWTKQRGIGESKEGFISIYRILSIKIIIRFIITYTEIADDEQPDNKVRNEPQDQEIFFRFVHLVICGSK